MSMQSTESSHPLLSHTDSIAASSADALVLVGRVLLGWLFLASSSGIGGKLWNVPGFAGYLKNLGMPAPEFWSWIGAPVEFVIGAALILGIGTRYAALLCALFLICATALAHRYWEYPPAQVAAQVPGRGRQPGGGRGQAVHLHPPAAEPMEVGPDHQCG